MREDPPGARPHYRYAHAWTQALTTHLYSGGLTTSAQDLPRLFKAYTRTSGMEWEIVWKERKGNDKIVV